LADNPGNEYKTGDLVRIEETRPMSRRKNWKIVKKVTAKELAE
jgi:small subunit ribosomal protein S17